MSKRGRQAYGVPMGSVETSPASRRGRARARRRQEERWAARSGPVTTTAIRPQIWPLTWDNTGVSVQATATAQACRCGLDGHEAHCARAWDHVTGAAGIASARRYALHVAEYDLDRARRCGDAPGFSGAAAAMAAGITARAVELGLETP